MRELNKVVKKNQYTLPIITDALRRRKGYKFLTKLEISLMFYTFPLDDESSKLCTIVTPFGPFQYNRIPVGLVNSPVFAQSRMEEVLRKVEDTEIYIDDIGIFSNSWDNHLKRLDTVLNKLQENNFVINPRTCE